MLQLLNFVRMRQLLTETDDLRLAIESMKNDHDEKFDIIFKTLNKMIAVDTKKNPIGFIWPVDKKA